MFFSGLDLTDFVMKTDEPAPIYDLVGVSCHSGGLGGGHYWAVCQNKDDKEWYKFDDSRVNSASDSDIDVRYSGPLIVFHSTFPIFKKKISKKKFWNFFQKIFFENFFENFFWKLFWKFFFLKRKKEFHYSFELLSISYPGSVLQNEKSPYILVFKHRTKRAEMAHSVKMEEEWNGPVQFQAAVTLSLGIF